EVRQADASSREMVRALPALWRGILYDDQARAAAWKIVADWSFDERLRVYRATPREGLHGTANGRPMREHCRELVAVARAGLMRLGAADELPLLAPLARIVDSGRTLADEISAEYQRVGGDVDEMIDFLRLR
ncbi:MAG: glutamate--cysteine ligase, partial [bacterium]|nr:glutamate--cysteine ligase [bacterium]